MALHGQAELTELRRLERWHQRYDRSFQNLEDFLADYPGLGTLHPFGATLAEEVKRLRPLKLPEMDWFRARRHKPGQTLTAAEMLPPDPHKIQIGVGRYNRAGQVGLYLAQMPHDCAVEIFPEPATPGELWIARIHMPAGLKALDLRIAPLGSQSIVPTVLEGLRHILRRKRSPDDHNPREYVLSQYLADLLRWRGFDAILYTSSRQFPFVDGFGEDMILLRYHQAVVKWGPRLVKWTRIEDFGVRMGFEPEVPIAPWEYLKESQSKTTETKTP